MAARDYRGGFAVRICDVQLLRRQLQHFPPRQPPNWEQLPHNLFLIDANAGTPVIAATAFPPPRNISLRRLHVLGAGIPGLIIDRLWNTQMCCFFW